MSLSLHSRVSRLPSRSLGNHSTRTTATHSTHTVVFDGEETYADAVMHGFCVCVVLKEAPRARAQYARACEANTVHGRWPRPPPLRALPQDRSQRPGGGGGQALLLLALGVAGGHGGQAGCLQPLQRVRHAAQLRVALLGREGRCAESPAIATRTFKGEYASCQRVGRPSSPRGVCQSCVWRDQIARAAHESPTAHAI